MIIIAPYSVTTEDCLLVDAVGVDASHPARLQDIHQDVGCGVGMEQPSAQDHRCAHHICRAAAEQNRHVEQLRNERHPLHCHHHRHLLQLELGELRISLSHPHDQEADAHIRSQEDDDEVVLDVIEVDDSGGRCLHGVHCADTRRL